MWRACVFLKKYVFSFESTTVLLVDADGVAFALSLRACLFVWCSNILQCDSAHPIRLEFSNFLFYLSSFEHITFFGVSSGQDLSLHSNRTEAGAKMSGRAASTSGLIEGQGRGEDRAAASYHRRTNSGDGSTIDRPARGQGESFTYSRFVEESRAADDVAEMTKFAVSVSSCKAGTQIYIDNNLSFFSNTFVDKKSSPLLPALCIETRTLAVYRQSIHAQHTYTRSATEGVRCVRFLRFDGVSISKSHILQKCQIYVSTVLSLFLTPLTTTFLFTPPLRTTGCSLGCRIVRSAALHSCSHCAI